MLGKKLKKAFKILFFGLLTSWTVKKSGLFDATFYCRKNNLAQVPFVVALFHYLFIGYRKRMAPSPYLHPDYYYSQITFPETERVEPIYHYIKKGWKQGVKPNLYFDTSRFLDFKSVAAKDFSNPLLWYIKEGESKQEPPCDVFDFAYYTNRYKDVEDSSYHPWSHLLYVGQKENLCPCRQLELRFDFCWYEKHGVTFFDEDQKDMQAVFERDLLAIVSRTAQSGSAYDAEDLSSQEQIDRALFNGWLHQMQLDDSKQDCSWFDSTYYKDNYLADDGPSTAIRHYCLRGVFAGNYPNHATASLKYKPVVSILVPVYNVQASYLNRCIRSVLFQSYPHWELCLADDCSTFPHIRRLLAVWAEIDSRIKFVSLEKNQGISVATNVAADLATGEYIGFLDNDDELLPEALFHVVKQINETQADFLYTDEELIEYTGKRAHVFHKPDFNQELLYAHNYITHFVVTRRALLEKLGGLDSTKNGAQDFDFLLKLSEIVTNPVHIPLSLYKWRATETSTTINHDSKTYADEAGRQAVVDALARQHINATVSGSDWEFYYRVKRAIPTIPKVHLICDCRKLGEYQGWVKNLKNSIQHMDFDLTVLTVPEHNRQLDDVRVVSVHADEHIVSVYNRIVEAGCEWILFVNSYLDVVQEQWVESLFEYAQSSRVGMVCGRRLPVDEDNYSIGVAPDLSNGRASYFAEYFHLNSVHMNGLQWSQDIFAAHIDFCMLHKQKWREMDGFSSRYRTLLFSSLDLSLRLNGAGYQNIYSSQAMMKEVRTEKQFESEQVLQQDLQLFKQRWLCQGKNPNPYFNTNVLADFGVNLDDFLRWYC